MVKKCSSCVSSLEVCKVHIRSGKCGACLRHGRRCDLQATLSEWDRLRKEREKLRSQLKEARESQQRARDAEERARADELKAREEGNTAFAKEMRLRQMLDHLESREAEAIAVEEAGIQQQEAEELLEFEASPSFTLSPRTWDLLAVNGHDVSSDFWIASSFAGPATLRP